MSSALAGGVAGAPTYPVMARLQFPKFGLPFTVRTVFGLAKNTHTQLLHVALSLQNSPYAAPQSERAAGGGLMLLGSCGHAASDKCMNPQVQIARRPSPRARAAG